MSCCERSDRACPGHGRDRHLSTYADRAWCRPCGLTPQGWLARRAVRRGGPTWRRTSQGLHVPADVELTPEQRIVEAAAVLRKDEAVAGWAALRWLGGVWFDGTDAYGGCRDVPLLARRDRAAPPGAAISQEYLHPDQIVVVDGVPVTIAVRSVVLRDEVRRLARRGRRCTRHGLLLRPRIDRRCRDVRRRARSGDGDPAGARCPAAGRRELVVSSRDEDAGCLEDGGAEGRAVQPTRCSRWMGATSERRTSSSPHTGLVGQYNGSDHITVAGTAADVKKDAIFRDHGLEPVTMLVTDWSDLDDYTTRLQSAAGRARCHVHPALLDPRAALVVDPDPHGRAPPRTRRPGSVPIPGLSAGRLAGAAVTVMGVVHRVRVARRPS